MQFAQWDQSTRHSQTKYGNTISFPVTEQAVCFHTSTKTIHAEFPTWDINSYTSKLFPASIELSPVPLLKDSWYMTNYKSKLQIIKDGKVIHYIMDWDPSVFNSFCHVLPYLTSRFLSLFLNSMNHFESLVLRSLALLERDTKPWYINIAVWYFKTWQTKNTCYLFVSVGQEPMHGWVPLVSGLSHDWLSVVLVCLALLCFVFLKVQLQGRPTSKLII
jgi:hypothetical protein